MEAGIFSKGVVPIYEVPCEAKNSKHGIVSAIADEGLYGMGAALTGEKINGFWPVMTHYHYHGFVKECDLECISMEGLKAFEKSGLMVVDAIRADILSLPLVQGECLISLGRGALVDVCEYESKEEGWSKVCLLDGRYGYIRTQFLIEKLFSQEGLWSDGLPQRVILDEAAFRNSVAETALKYQGAQYRWGGKSMDGIDCSGLTSMSYMLNGILIYRDAKIMEGFPVKEIPFARKKKGDLLYFPGHIAMYLEDGFYVHSTGKIGSGGVVVNSLVPENEGYREDLAKSMTMVGSVF